jgi:hypothetical protein
MGNISNPFSLIIFDKSEKPANSSFFKLIFIAISHKLATLTYLSFESFSITDLAILESFFSHSKTRLRHEYLIYSLWASDGD